MKKEKYKFRVRYCDSPDVYKIEFKRNVWYRFLLWWEELAKAEGLLYKYVAIMFDKFDDAIAFVEKIKYDPEWIKNHYEKEERNWKAREQKKKDKFRKKNKSYST